jgi:surfactin synthase thioesterase subunit
MVEKLHKSLPGGHVYLLVAAEKFTKWIERIPVTPADASSTVNFIKE